MTKKLFILSSALALVISSTTVLADDAYSLGSHPYVGVGAGYGGMYFGGDSVQNSGFTYQINGGYSWRLAKHFALGVEVGYTGYPKINSTTQFSFSLPVDWFYTTNTAINNKDTLTGGSASAVLAAQFFITSRFSLSAKAGIAYMMQTDTNSATTTITTTRLDGSSTSSTADTSLGARDIRAYAPVIGLGAAYAINKHLSVTLDSQMLLSPNYSDGLAGHILKAQGPAAYSVLAGLSYGF